MPQKRATSETQSVLVFGAGLMAKPIVMYLVNHKYKVILASRTKAKADAIFANLPKELTLAVGVDLEKDPNAVSNIDALVKAERPAAMISMLPYLYHAKVAEIAIKHKTHFLTTSYINDGVKALEKAAEDAGIIMVMECGVDPGTDHMSAKKIIDRSQARGGKLVKFSSYCGGLPRKKDDNNPVGYKFSWAPRGVLLAACNPAKFLEGGQPTPVEPTGVWSDRVEQTTINGVDYDCMLNRDCTIYRDLYHVPTIKELRRGTFRYAGGFTKFIQILHGLGLMNVEKKALSGLTHAAVIKQAVAAKGGKTDGSAQQAVCTLLKVGADHPGIKIANWLALFCDKTKVGTSDSYLDFVSDLMQAKKEISYGPAEADCIVMEHKYTFDYPDRTENLRTTLYCEGEPGGDSAMSKTVGYPVAIVARMVLEGRLEGMTGLVIPTIPELYIRILDELEEYNIKFVDEVVSVVTK